MLVLFMTLSLDLRSKILTEDSAEPNCLAESLDEVRPNPKVRCTTTLIWMESITQDTFKANKALVSDHPGPS